MLANGFFRRKYTIYAYHVGGLRSRYCSVRSVIGSGGGVCVVTIPAQTLPSGTGRYYYYVTCTVLGVPTVIATCYLEVTNI